MPKEAARAQFVMEHNTCGKWVIDFDLVGKTGSVPPRDREERMIGGTAGASSRLERISSLHKNTSRGGVIHRRLPGNSLRDGEPPVGAHTTALDMNVRRTVHVVRSDDPSK